MLNLENGKSWTLPTVVKFPLNSLHDFCASKTAIGKKKKVQPAGVVVFNMSFRKAQCTLKSSEKSVCNSLMLPWFSSAGGSAIYDQINGTDLKTGVCGGGLFSSVKQKMGGNKCQFNQRIKPKLFG